MLHHYLLFKWTTPPGDVVHPVVGGTSGSTNSEMILLVPSETSGGVLYVKWCNDATALAGYAPLTTTTTTMMLIIQS